MASTLLAMAPEDMNRRYWAWLQVGGKQSDGLYQYICWITKNVADFRREIGRDRREPLDHDAFDEWLVRRYRLADPATF